MPKWLVQLSGNTSSVPHQETAECSCPTHVYVVSSIYIVMVLSEYAKLRILTIWRGDLGPTWITELLRKHEDIQTTRKSVSLFLARYVTPVVMLGTYKYRCMQYMLLCINSPITVQKPLSNKSSSTMLPTCTCMHV